MFHSFFFLRSIVFQAPQTTGVVSFELPRVPKLTTFPLYLGPIQEAPIFGHPTGVKKKHENLAPK